ncbi:MAG: hypothetical protein ACFE9T_00970 [Promethearchaeota archaeon]
MATHNKVRDIDHNVGFSCDLCNSENIQETIQGYVCGDCGIVLEVQKLEYHRPYNDDIIQYSPLGQTQIGTAKERSCSPHSTHLKTLNKLHSIQDNEKVVINNAKGEISRIFSNLHLPKIYQSIVLKRFKEVRSKFLPGTKYRSVEKLIPIVIYYTFKLENIVINEIDLINASRISKKDFNNFKLQRDYYLPEYKSRVREEYILQKILYVTEHFGLGMEFFYLSKKIMYRLWKMIKNTTDDVIAGVATSIAVLCSYKGMVSVNAICNTIGVRMSTIQFQVKERIFESLKLNGFISLVHSSDLLKKIIQKLGIIKPKIERVEPVDIVEILLGSASQVFNSHNQIDYYFFALRSIENNPILIKIGTYNLLEEMDPKKRKEVQTGMLFEYETLIYYTTKDPPISIT